MSQIQSSNALKNTKIVCDLLENAISMDYIGEPISQLEHALQAAHFAKQADMSTEGVLAALLHDIGHLLDGDHEQMGGYGTLSHERLGAQYLADLGFSEKVCILVESHVPAKRYLVSTSQAYYDRLSSASKESLKYQGGGMTKDEVEAFKKQVYFREILLLRLADEKAKVPNLSCLGLEHYKAIIQDHLSRV